MPCAGLQKVAGIFGCESRSSKSSLKLQVKLTESCGVATEAHRLLQQLKFIELEFLWLVRSNYYCLSFRLSSPTCMHLCVLVCVSCCVFFSGRSNFLATIICWVAGSLAQPSSFLLNHRGKPRWYDEIAAHRRLECPNLLWAKSCTSSPFDGAESRASNNHHNTPSSLRSTRSPITT